MLPLASTTSSSAHNAMMLTSSNISNGGGSASVSISGREDRHRTGSVTSVTSFDSLHQDLESLVNNASNHNNNNSHHNTSTSHSSNNESSTMISAAKLLFQDCAQGEDDKPVRARRIEYKQPPSQQQQVTYLASTFTAPTHTTYPYLHLLNYTRTYH